MKGPRSMARSVARLARDLSGRSADDLVALLGDQLACTERGARLVMSMAEGSLPTGEAHRCMREVEHDGDEARAELVATLGQVLSTPIDAEDMFRLSRSIDDVLDNLRDFVREVDLTAPRTLASPCPLALPLGPDPARGTGVPSPGPRVAGGPSRQRAPGRPRYSQGGRAAAPALPAAAGRAAERAA